MIIPQKKILAFQKEILDWYALHKRDLPWRKTRDPYKILVSEIMLQQTQVIRVIPKYEAWLLAFPTVFDLANAKTADVLQHWSGLGYNRRALYLQKCAKTVSEKYNGVFPNKKEVLKTLPGIGEYTAAAVACFAFDEQIAVIDTNIRKVILTKFTIANYTIRSGDKEIQQIADQVVLYGKAYEWNQALMDYASAMLKKEKIPIAKQSRFKDSDRYFRGQIIKHLLLKKHMSKKQLLEYFDLQQNPLDEKRLESILEGLVKNELIQRRGNTYVLP